MDDNGFSPARCVGTALGPARESKPDETNTEK